MADNAAALAQIQQAGVPTSFLDQFRGDKSGPLKGSSLDPQDVSGVVGAFNSPGYQVPLQMQQLASQKYAFDPQQYLPGIQATADSIYAPQQAQLEAIRQLQQASYTDQKVQSEKDFAKRMKQEVEAINQRGAFFGGGAIQNEQDLRSQFQSQEFQGSLQFAAANYSNLAQQAQLQAEKTQFIQDRLVNADNSAYARWQDARNFSFQALQAQYQVFQDQRNFARAVFESDRSYKLDVARFEEAKTEFKKTFGLDQARFDFAKAQYNESKKNGASDTLSLNDFLSKFATKNDGALGKNANGQDNYDLAASSYPGPTQQVNTGVPGSSGFTFSFANPIGQNADGSIIYEKNK